MRCLTSIEAEDLVKPAGFHISVKPEWRRVALVLDTNIASRQRRVGGRPTPDVTRLARFAEALNRWLPSSRHRLLWIDHWSSDVPSVYETFMAARAGLGEMRSISEAPGHYFDSYVWSERDQTAISADQARETGLLVGLMSLLMVDSWDGWLVADGSERIEFWEGNLFLYSVEKGRLAHADSLLNEFDCNRALEQLVSSNDVAGEDGDTPLHPAKGNKMVRLLLARVPIPIAKTSSASRAEPLLEKSSDPEIIAGLRDTPALTMREFGELREFGGHNT